MIESQNDAKAAALLISLGPEAAAGILAKMAPEKAQRVQARMKELDQGPPGELVMAAVRQAEASLVAAAAGPATAEPAAPPPEPAAPEPPEKPEPAAIADEDILSDPINLLRQLDVDRLTAALCGEQAHTVCIVLGCLCPEQVGEVLKRLPPEVRQKAFTRLAVAGALPNRVVLRVLQTVLHKAQAQSLDPVSAGRSAAPVFQQMAAALRGLPAAERSELLGALGESDAEAAALVRDQLYAFDDLLNLADQSIQKLLGEADMSVLATALKGASPAIKDRVLRNLSKRARESMYEEMNFVSASPAQIQQAQKRIVEILQTLDQAGEMVMIK